MLNRKGQSVLEYAVLLMIVIAAIMIMQVFMKRSIQGRFKQSSEEIGDQFSAGRSTEIQQRNLTSNQTIQEETTTQGDALTQLGWSTDKPLTGTVDKGAFSYTHRKGGDATTTTERTTDAAKKETFKWKEYDDHEYEDFVIPEGGGGGGGGGD